MRQILIAEDETRIASFIKKGLKAAGMHPTVVEDGISAQEHALSGSYDLMILDIGLPGRDGFEVLENLRGQGVTMPIIILTARDSVTDTVRGLDEGANDYMAKPFRFEELLARINLRLRDAAPNAGNTAATSSILVYGDVSLDLLSRQITVDGQTIDLSAREFGLAETFMQNGGQVLSREQLLSEVWGFDFDPGSNVVDVSVRYLRRKIGAERIETVRGMGYRFVG